MGNFTEKDLVEIVEASHENQDWEMYDAAFEELRQRGYFA